MSAAKFVNCIVKEVFMLTTSVKQSSNNCEHIKKTEVSFLPILNILTTKAIP